MNLEYEETMRLSEMMHRKHWASSKHSITMKDVDNDLENGRLILLSDP